MVTVDTLKACASLAGTLQLLCYQANAEHVEGGAGSNVDPTLSTLIADGDVPQNLVAELYPLDYGMMIDLFITSLTGVDADVRRENLRVQYLDAIRMMSELDYIWISENGTWESPASHFDMAQREHDSLINQVKALLEEAHLLWGPPDKHYAESDVRNFQLQARQDAETLLYFFMNIAAGDAYAQRCAAVTAVGELGYLSKNLPWLEKFFVSVLTDAPLVNGRRRHRTAPRA